MMMFPHYKITKYIAYLSQDETILHSRKQKNPVSQKSVESAIINQQLKQTKLSKGKPSARERIIPLSNIKNH